MKSRCIPPTSRHRGGLRDQLAPSLKIYLLQSPTAEVGGLGSQQRQPALLSINPFQNYTVTKWFWGQKLAENISTETLIQTLAVLSKSFEKNDCTCTSNSSITANYISEAAGSFFVQHWHINKTSPLGKPPKSGCNSSFSHRCKGIFPLSDHTFKVSFLYHKPELKVEDFSLQPTETRVSIGSTPTQ